MISLQRSTGMEPITRVATGAVDSWGGISGYNSSIFLEEFNGILGLGTLEGLLIDDDYFSRFRRRF